MTAYGTSETSGNVRFSAAYEGEPDTRGICCHAVAIATEVLATERLIPRLSTCQPPDQACNENAAEPEAPPFSLRFRPFPQSIHKFAIPLLGLGIVGAVILVELFPT